MDKIQEWRNGRQHVLIAKKGERMGTTVTVNEGKIDGYLTVSEYAKEMGMIEGTVRQLIARGQLETLQIGDKNWKMNFIKEGTLPVYKKRGRPRKIEDGRNNEIRIRLTDQELDTLNKLAKERRTTKSDILRSVLSSKLNLDTQQEFICEIIEHFENFLNMKGIELDNPEKQEAVDAGEEEDSICNIYGTDYGWLQSDIEGSLKSWGLIKEGETE